MALRPSSFEVNAHAVHEMLGEEQDGKCVILNDRLRDQLLHMLLYEDGPRLDKVVTIWNMRM